MKKYFMVATSLALLIGLVEGYRCGKKQVGITEIVPTESSPSYSVPIFYDQALQEEISSDVDMYDFVNDEVYQHLLEAKTNFNRLYVNGEVSSQMRNRGTVLSQSEASDIDSRMLRLYRLIYDYVLYYQQGDVESCYRTAKVLFEVNILPKEYLYNVLVSRKLPPECQSGIDFSQHDFIYDVSGNIILRDGRRLKVVGGEDAIVGADPILENGYNATTYLSKWYETLPNIILNEYASLKNSRGYDGICYVWNQSSVEQTCYNEWHDLRITGQEMYGFDPDQVSIYWNSELATYVFVDQYNREFPFDALSAARLDQLYEVQDGCATHEGDVYFLDQYLKNMKSYHATKGYSR